jgi:hypothetical protein
MIKLRGLAAVTGALLLLTGCAHAETGPDPAKVASLDPASGGLAPAALSGGQADDPLLCGLPGEPAIPDVTVAQHAVPGVTIPQHALPDVTIPQHALPGRPAEEGEITPPLGRPGDDQPQPIPPTLVPSLVADVPGPNKTQSGDETWPAPGLPQESGCGTGRGAPMIPLGDPADSEGGPRDEAALGRPRPAGAAGPRSSPHWAWVRSHR